MRGVIRGHGEKTVYLIDGREVTKAAFDLVFPDRPIGSGAGLFGFTPIVSDALAVHPSQVKEATEDAIRKGVPTDFQPDGRPVLRTRQHRKEYMQKYGFFDRTAGYGDAADGSCKRDVPDRPDPRTLY